MILAKAVPMFLVDKNNVYLLLEPLLKIQIFMYLMIAFLLLTLKRMQNYVENLQKSQKIKQY